MKTKIYLCLFCSLIVFSSTKTFAQINSFPYVQDFENFTNLQIDAVCDTVAARYSADGWLQDSTDGGDWRADSAGTGTLGTGPGSTDTTTGVGVGTDVNPGTTGGIYLYIEATSPTGLSCNYVETALISPVFDFSASGTFYKMGLYYNMHGNAMGSLVIDVIEDDTVLHTNIASVVGDQGEGWYELEVNLANFNGDNIRIRIRSIMGAQVTGDLAIDQFSISELTPPSYDAILNAVSFTPNVYLLNTVRQHDSLEFTAIIKNEGIDSITGTRVIASSSSYADTVIIGTLGSYETATAVFSRKYQPGQIGINNITFTVDINEADSFAFNNSRTLEVVVSDTIMAREDGVAIGGIGFNPGSGYIGQKFRLLEQDTLTTITFYVNAPTNGDSVQVHLYEFVSGTGPTNQIASAPIVTYISTQNWYTVRFPCEQILSAGEYFVAVQQLVVSSNMSLGYTNKNYRSNSGFYNGGATWVPLENANFPITLLLRFNFGKKFLPNVTITSADTVCSATQFFLVGGGASTYSWQPASIVLAPNAQSTPAKITSPQTFTLTGTNVCGISGTVSKTIYVEPGPSGNISPDQTICKGQSATLQASGGSTYNWIGGPSNSNFIVSPQRDTSYIVKIDSNNGCFLTLSTKVKVNTISVSAMKDTTLCSGGTVTLTASGGATYEWINGPNTATYQFTADTSASYIVHGYDSVGCTDSAMVEVVVLPSPTVDLPEDTGACFRDSLYLIASGAENYEWKNGPNKAVYPLRVLTSGWYFLRAYNSNGCEVNDSIYVERHLIPFGQVFSDTGICEGDSVVLTVTGGERYEWSHGPETDQVTVSPLVTTKYKARVLNDFGCFSEDSAIVSVDPLPRAAFELLQVNDSVIRLTDKSQFSDEILWQFGDGDTSTLSNPEHTFTADGNYNITLTSINDCGSEDSSIIITIILPKKESIGDLEFWKELQLYPNPSTGHIVIEFSNGLSGEIELEVLDAAGQLISTGTGFKSGPQFKQALDLTDLEAGVYWIKIRMNGSEISRLLVIY